tara:strand:- start:2487 stop:3566 length:1080 start_codon:yes stop_codon:yes gene_type:complete
MIEDHNIQISEPEYRDLDYPSYSLLASISKQGVDVLTGVKGNFFQLKFGSLVDDMCFEPSKLANYYHAKAASPPTGNPRKIADAVLAGINVEVGGVMESGGFIKTRKKKVTTDIKDYENECIAAVRSAVPKMYEKYDDKKIMGVMIDKCSDYFSDQLKTRGKVHIKPEMWASALEAADTLKTHDFTRGYFVEEDGIDLYYQYKFVQQICGVKVKGMLDCMVVDHNSQTIYPVDLKTGESPASMFDEVLLLHKYYLQASLYRAAIMEIVKKDPDLSGYTVANFEFVYLSKMNLQKPLIWVVPSELHYAGFTGFTDRFGFKHKGLKELLEMFTECKSGMYCQYTKETYNNEGRVMLKGLIR